MPDVPGAPGAEELPAAELAARLAEAYRLIGELSARNEQLAALNEQLAARVGQLERRAGKDSSTSSRPPSSDSPDKKKSRDRSLRERGKRQPGEPGSTMNLVDDPDETIACPPLACGGCGADLAGAPVTAQRRLQVTDISPAPKTTEYLAQAKACAGCGATSTGELPGHVRARASYGPEACAQAANLVSGHYVPVYRATLLCQLAGIKVSSGWMAGVRGKAAALAEASGFMERIRELLRTAPAVHADETPARAAGGMRYVHLACTRYLTCLHTGDRSAAAIDAGGVLPGYDGVLVRDGYIGYAHLTGALHAWCGAHLLRDLKDLYDFEPAGQDWARAMAGLLIEARAAAAAARTAGDTALDAAVLAGLLTRPDLDIFSNNEAERTIRPVKVQMRSPIRARPVLPIHRRQMGHRQARRAPQTVHRPHLAAARPRTHLTPQTRQDHITPPAPAE